MCKLSEKEIKRVLNGDDTPIGRLYAENYDDLMRGVRGGTKTKYSREDIEDAIQEAFFVVRRNIKRPDFRNDNICGFIVVVAYRMLIGGSPPSVYTDIEELERIIARIQGIHDEDSSNPDDEQLRKKYVALKAWENFGGACKRLLEKNWVEERRLIDIWQELGYASYDVARTTKSRCVKNLRKKANDLLNADKQK